MGGYPRRIEDWDRWRSRLQRWLRFETESELTHFIDQWGWEHFPPTQPCPAAVKNYGSECEPKRSVYLACHAAGMRDKWRDGLCVLDYGCGAGKFFNYMSQRWENFRYYGLEKGGSWYRWGEETIDQAILDFSHDQRAVFGMIDTPLWDVAIRECDVVLLVSIFTHTSLEDLEMILGSFGPALERGSRVVFSVHHRNDDRYERQGMEFYGMPGFYPKTFVPRAFLHDMCRRMGLKLEYESRIATIHDVADGEQYHYIYSARRYESL